MNLTIMKQIVAFGILAGGLVGQTPSLSSVASYSQIAPDRNDATVRSGYRGFDPEAVVAALERLGVGASKSEFETTAEYEKRKAGIGTQQLFPGILVSGRLAFVLNDPDALDTARLSYDADAQNFIITVALNKQLLYDAPGSPVLFTTVLKSNVESASHFVGENAYGATADVHRISASDFGLVVRQGTWLTTPRELPENLAPREGVTFKLPIPAERAKSSAAHLRVLLLGFLQSPWIYHDFRSNSATLDNPTEYSALRRYLWVDPQELWVFDEQSGIVLTKITEESLNAAAEKIEAERQSAHARLYPMQLQISVAGKRKTPDLLGDYIEYQADDGKVFQTELMFLPMSIEARSAIRVAVANHEVTKKLTFTMNGKAVIPEWRTDKTYWKHGETTRIEYSAVVQQQ